MPSGGGFGDRDRCPWGVGVVTDGLLTAGVTAGRKAVCRSDSDSYLPVWHQPITWG